MTQERSGGGLPRWLLAVVAATLAAVLGLVAVIGALWVKVVMRRALFGATDDVG